jgi:TRAP-type C4-dicarboxylate transport system permease small subunit
MPLLKKAYSLLCLLEVVAGVILCLTIAFTIALQVFCRYVLNQPLTWTTDLSKYCLVWLTFIGGSYVLRRQRHISISVFMRMTPERFQRFGELLSNLLVIAVLIIVGLTSFPFIKMSAKLEAVTLGVSMAYIYAAFPIGLGLMLIHLVVQVINQSRRLANEE